MGYKSKKFIVKKTINKLNQPKGFTCSYVSCFCNLCKGNLVDPRTRKAYILKKDVVTRNIGESSSKPTGLMALSELDFSELDLLELDFSDIDLPEPSIKESMQIDLELSIEESMQIDLSDNDSVISNSDVEYSFITKEQSKKGKKPIGSGGRRIKIPVNVENFFSDEEDELIDVEDEELTDQEIDFNTPEFLAEVIESDESIDINKCFM